MRTGNKTQAEEIREPFPPGMGLMRKKINRG